LFWDFVRYSFKALPNSTDKLSPIKTKVKL
jgi:hypothetical protein